MGEGGIMKLLDLTVTLIIVALGFALAIFLPTNWLAWFGRALLVGIFILLALCWDATDRRR